MKRSTFAYPYMVWMLVLILAPMLLIIYYAFTGKMDARVVFSFDNITKAFDPMFMDVLIRSLSIALLSTLICLAMGFPVAYALSKMPVKKAATLSVFFIVPMWMNFLLRTYAWMALLDNNGLLNNLFKLLGLGHIQLMYNSQAVVLGTVYNFLPFMVLPIYNALCKIEKSHIEAAQDLGANGRDVFRKIILPLSLPGVISGITLVFVPSITTFAISRLLGGAQFMLYGDLIENQFIQMQNWNFGSALSVVMLALVTISMVVLNKYDKGSEGGSLL